MRIAVYQCEPGPVDPAGNLRRLERQARAAAKRGARLLITPEMYLSGYNIGAAAARRLAEPRDGPSAAALSEIARGAGLALLTGYPELGEDGCVYNAARLLGSDGRPLAHCRKSHLFGELDRSMFAAADGGFDLAELEGWRLGILICYDVEFPEAVRRLALAGADLVLVPTANMTPYDAVARTLVPARALENQVYLAYANYCGREGELEYCGLSCLVAPDAADVSRAGRGEALIVGDIDRESLRESRRINTYLADRRPQLYHALAATPPEAETT